MAYPVSNFILLVVRCVGLVNIVNTDPFLAALVELDEDRVVRIGDANAAFALVNDRLEGLERGLGIDDYCHLLVEEFRPGELLVLVAREKMLVGLGNFEDTCDANATPSTAVLSRGTL